MVMFLESGHHSSPSCPTPQLSLATTLRVSLSGDCTVIPILLRALYLPTQPLSPPLCTPFWFPSGVSVPWKMKYLITLLFSKILCFILAWIKPLLLSRILPLQELEWEEAPMGPGVASAFIWVLRQLPGCINFPSPLKFMSSDSTIFF